MDNFFKMLSLGLFLVPFYEKKGTKKRPKLSILKKFSTTPRSTVCSVCQAVERVYLIIKLQSQPRHSRSSPSQQELEKKIDAIGTNTEILNQIQKF